VYVKFSLVSGVRYDGLNGCRESVLNWLGIADVHENNAVRNSRLQKVFLALRSVV
jgi:hypothetical protein